MALVVKRETMIQRQREEALFVRKKLENEIIAIKQEHRLTILKQSLIWMAVLGGALFFVFPIGCIIGWFIGRDRVLQQLCGLQRQQLREVDQKIKLQLGEAGENKVSMMIERELPDHLFLLNDLVIPNGRKGTQIDHVLIGDGRIYCIETKDITGKFYPHKNGWLWYPTHSRGNVKKKTIVKNPQYQSIYHATHLRKLLQAYGYSLEIKPIVILTNPSGEWKGRQDFRCPIFRVREFIHYVQQENEVQISTKTKEEIAKLLLEHDRRNSELFYNQFGFIN